MKKFYAIAAMALFGVTVTVNAQALKLENNYVMKTCVKLPDGTTAATDGEGTPSAKLVPTDFVKKMEEAFIDDDFNTFPISGGVAEGANFHVLTADYTDAETGISFKKGTYACLNSNTEIKFKDAYNPQGLANVKQVIFYLASQGQLQYYARQYEGENTEDYCHFEGDPTNRKLKSYKAPGFNTETWTEMNFTKPLKVVIDFTNAQGTDDEMKNANLDVNKSSDDVEVQKSLLQFYEKAFDADGKMIQGDKLIPWTENGKFVFAFKKKAYVMGIAVICGNDKASSKYIDVADANPQWSDKISTGISSVTSEKFAQDDAIYTLQGVRVAKATKGIYIINGKKVVVK